MTKFISYKNTFLLIFLFVSYFQTTAQDIPAPNPLPMGGIYTIGPDTSNDYQTINAAISSIKQNGISSPVIFKLDSVTFNEPVNLSGTINGLSSLNTLTFKGYGDKTIIDTLSSSTHPYLFSINGLAHIIIDSISFRRTNVFGGKFLNIVNTDYLTIKNCKFSSPKFLQYNKSTTMIKIGTTNYHILQHITIVNNKFYGGTNHINIVGYSNSYHSNNLTIENNLLSNFTGTGINIYYYDKLSISNNIIKTSNEKETRPVNGIFIKYSNGKAVITNNKISLRGKKINGISLNTVKGTNTQNAIDIHNNMISTDLLPYQYVYFNKAYGLNLDNTGLCNIYYNSTSVYGTSGISRAINVSITNSNYANNIIKNNIFAVYGKGYAAYFAGQYFPTQISGCDYNNLFSTDTLFAYYGGVNKSNLASWKSINSGFAAHSVSMNPFYYSKTDLHTNSNTLNNHGVSLPGITNDIDNQPRSTLHPDMGADEYKPKSYDIGLLEWVLPQHCISPGTYHVRLKIVNNGTLSASNIPVKYSIDGGTTYFHDTIASTINSHDTLFYTFTDSITLSTGVKSCIAIIDNPLDSMPVNDTTKQEVVAFNSLSGIYTLGKNATDDFHSFNELKAALECTGLSGAVTVLVDSGIYNERVSFEKIQSTSASHPLIIKGKGNKTILTSTYADVYNRHIILLDSASYITLDSLTIIQDELASCFWGICLLRNSNYVSIKNCNINAKAYGSDNYFGIVSTGSYSSMNSNGSSNHLIISNNSITGGKDGVFLKGDIYNKNPNNQILNNTFNNQVSSAIHIMDNRFYIVNGNKISSGPNTNHKGTALLIDRSEKGVSISKNKIDWKGNFGIKLDDDNYSANRIKVSNNFIYVHPDLPPATMDNIVAGIFLYCQRTNIYHNSVKVAGLASNNGYPLYFWFPISTIYIKNNVFANYNNNGAPIGINYSVPNSSYYHFNYNCLYTHSTSIAVVGAGLSNPNPIATLSAWKQLSGANNSISADPKFVTANDLHSVSPAMWHHGIALSSITTDIDGEARHPAYPDIGADEYSPINLYLGPDKTICSNDSVLLTANNISGAHYAWYFNSMLLPDTLNHIYADTAGIYYLKLTSGFTNVYDTVNISEIPAPIVNLGPDTTLKLTHNDTLVLDAGNAGASYLWFNGDTNQVQAFTNSNLSLGKTLIYVDVTKNTCTSSDTLIIFLTDDTSIGKHKRNAFIKVYPNPSKGDFFIETPINQNNASISIFNTNGKKVFSTKLQKAANNRIRLKNLTAGVYYLVYSEGQKVLTQKLVVQP